MIWACLYSLYCFTDNMNNYVILYNASFLKFSATSFLILGMMPKMVPRNKSMVGFTKHPNPIFKILLRYWDA